MDVLENAVTEKNVLVEAAAFPTDDRVTYKDSTYEIVSKDAYLIGVPKRIFDNEHEACLLYTSPWLIRWQKSRRKTGRFTIWQHCWKLCYTSC